MGPLTCSELGDAFDVASALQKGLLPGVYTEGDRETWTKVLRSYATTYLREEVQAEALTRNLEGFSRFFDVVCAGSGDFIDFTKFASRAAIERMTARRYFDVLVDTLVLRSVDAFTKSARRRLVQHPRYYLFDVGVLNGALRNFETSADRSGNLFEHLVLQLIVSEAAARDLECRVSVYRTEAGAEVDFIVELDREVFAIEVKNSRAVTKADLRGLASFREFYGRRHTALVVYRGERPLVVEGVDVLPVARALAALGLGRA